VTSDNARLEAIAFAESARAAALPLAKVDVLEAARRFLLVCYEDVGVAPQKLDGDQLREAALTHLARRVFAKDAFAPHVPALLRAFFQDLEERALVPHAFELKLALDDVADRFAGALRAVPDQERRLDDTPVAPITRPGAKIGRNDPCPCGSGKKYKQCCLRLL
jgi:hypothetical protein